MCGEVPSGDEFGDLRPAVAVEGVELNEVCFFFGRPLLLTDAALEVVVVSFAALLAIASLDAVSFHNLRYLTPFLNPPSFEELLQKLVLLCSDGDIPRVSISCAHSFSSIYSS
jgi:hypothetical protein